ncbi:MAG: hypothetical protein HY928_13975 [Elusimicrobia bacterium]|nr:hypothetical protein [Elusimicrobiota bacterium]
MALPENESGEPATGWDAITDIETARATLRWALERVRSLEVERREASAARSAAEAQGALEGARRALGELHAAALEGWLVRRSGALHETSAAAAELAARMGDLEAVAQRALEAVAALRRGAEAAGDAGLCASLERGLADLKERAQAHGRWKGMMTGLDAIGGARDALVRDLDALNLPAGRGAPPEPRRLPESMVDVFAPAPRPPRKGRPPGEENLEVWRLRAELARLKDLAEDMRAEMAKGERFSLGEILQMVRERDLLRGRLAEMESEMAAMRESAEAEAARLRGEADRSRREGAAASAMAAAGEEALRRAREAAQHNEQAMRAALDQGRLLRAERDEAAVSLRAAQERLRQAEGRAQAAEAARDSAAAASAGLEALVSDARGQFEAARARAASLQSEVDGLRRESGESGSALRAKTLELARALSEAESARAAAAEAERRARGAEGAIEQVRGELAKAVAEASRSAAEASRSSAQASRSAAEAATLRSDLATASADLAEARARASEVSRMASAELESARRETDSLRSRSPRGAPPPETAALLERCAALEADAGRLCSKAEASASEAAAAREDAAELRRRLETACDELAAARARLAVPSFDAEAVTMIGPSPAAAEQAASDSRELEQARDDARAAREESARVGGEAALLRERVVRMETAQAQAGPSAQEYEAVIEELFELVRSHLRGDTGA